MFLQYDENSKADLCMLEFMLRLINFQQSYGHGGGGAKTRDFLEMPATNFVTPWPILVSVLGPN